MCVHVCAQAMVPIWRSEDSLWESVIAFHYMGPTDGPQLVRFNNSCLYPLSHFSDPDSIFLISMCVCGGAFVYDVWVGTHTPWHVCGSERITSWSPVSQLYMVSGCQVCLVSHYPLSHLTSQGTSSNTLLFSCF